MIRFPDATQHIAIAGRTGSGKTWGALEMLSARDMHDMAWVVIDHKRDENIAQLPAEKINPGAMFLPSRGLHVLNADMSKESRENIEGFLVRAFEKGKIGIYVDEGHLLGHSDAIRNILVAGRSKKVPLMWTSQRAHWIDPFIWSQSSFYRVFDLQSPLDIKRFNENFPIRWKKPDEYHSYYYDVSKGLTHYLIPSKPMETTLNRFDDKLKTRFNAIG